MVAFWWNLGRFLCKCHLSSYYTLPFRHKGLDTRALPILAKVSSTELYPRHIHFPCATFLNAHICFLSFKNILSVENSIQCILIRFIPHSSSQLFHTPHNFISSFLLLNLILHLTSICVVHVLLGVGPSTGESSLTWSHNLKENRFSLI